ncbi:hypothetical protein ACRRTK_015173 [Alexandromys fortis]
MWNTFWSWSWIKKECLAQTWCTIPLIPKLERQSQGISEFKANLIYLLISQLPKAT